MGTRRALPLVATAMLVSACVSEPRGASGPVTFDNSAASLVARHDCLDGATRAEGGPVGSFDGKALDAPGFNQIVSSWVDAHPKSMPVEPAAQMYFKTKLADEFLERAALLTMLAVANISPPGFTAASSNDASIDAFFLDSVGVAALTSRYLSAGALPRRTVTDEEMQQTDHSLLDSDVSLMRYDLAPAGHDGKATILDMPPALCDSLRQNGAVKKELPLVLYDWGLADDVTQVLRKAPLKSLVSIACYDGVLTYRILSRQPVGLSPSVDITANIRASLQERTARAQLAALVADELRRHEATNSIAPRNKACETALKDVANGEQR